MTNAVIALSFTVSSVKTLWDKCKPSASKVQRPTLELRPGTVGWRVQHLIRGQSSVCATGRMFRSSPCKLILPRRICFHPCQFVGWFVCLFVCEQDYTKTLVEFWRRSRSGRESRDFHVSRRKKLEMRRELSVCNMDLVNLNVVLWVLVEVPALLSAILLLLKMVNAEYLSYTIDGRRTFPGNLLYSASEPLRTRPADTNKGQ